MNPHRQPPCETCTTRESLEKTLQPFKDQNCPACTAHAPPIEFEVVCYGGMRFITKRGFWLFGWRGRIVQTCGTRGVYDMPSHFHMYCRHCGYRWKRLTALESAR